VTPGSAERRTAASILYISYDGVLEPLGESQVVSYLERLASDHVITLMSFEKADDARDVARMAAMSGRLSARHIDWVPMRYHKRPPVISTAFDTLAGMLRGRRIARARAAQIVHARGYIPALIALGVRGVNRSAFLFDMRGFWLDEKVEAGHWTRGGPLYRIGKWWERRFYAAADAVVSLTAAGARAIPELGVAIRPGVPIEVIPTCADLQRFSPGPKDAALASRLGVSGAPVIGCVGTMSNWYMRQEMIDCLAVFARSWTELRVLIVTRDDHQALRADLERAGVPAGRLTIVSATFEEMPSHVRLFDAGLFFIKPSFSKRASAATKLAEFLGCGVPVIINGGVGDSGAIVRERGAGVVETVPGAGVFERMLTMTRALLADPAVAQRCRDAALAVFDLDTGVEHYRQVYAQLLERRDH
jgi:glycosyltransferase involved in cell wall biosynthesis